MLTAVADRLAPDAELQRRFADARDQAAFAELVRRHGRLVLGVCRRVAGDTHLADDAFQAAFVVLAAKPTAAGPGKLPAFLHAVAVRAALRARTMAGRRRKREVAAELPDVPHLDPEPDDAVRLLDEEIARLSPAVREAVVLCELDGVPRRDAAARLGVPEGTLSSRLAAARKTLAARLKSRGVVFPAAVAVPPALSAAARAAALGTVPPSVSILARGVLRTMYLSELKRSVVLAAVVAACTLGLAARPAPADDPAKPAAAKAAGRGKLLVWRNTKHVWLTPDGKPAGEVPFEKKLIQEFAPSPDGKRVAAVVVAEDDPVDENRLAKTSLVIAPADGKGEPKKLDVRAIHVSWTADDKLLAVEVISAKEPADRGFKNWLIDPATGKGAELPNLSKWTAVYERTPDGTGYVGTVFDVEGRKILLALVGRDGKATELTRLTVEVANPKVSPDGTRILFVDYDREEAEKATPDLKKGTGFPLMRLWVYDVAAKKRERLAEVPENAQVMGYTWSPDGKRLAYTWKPDRPDVPRAVNTDNMNDPALDTETETFLVVADRDGKNPKTVASEKSPRAPTITLGRVAWR